MATGQFTGVIPASITPLTNDQSLDESALAAHVQRLADAGADGVLIGGGTGEFATLTAHERRSAVDVAVRVAPEGFQVVAHVGALSNREAVDHARHASERGVSGLMVGVPFYEPLGREQVLQYFADIAEVSSLPLMAYNYPYATQLVFDVELLESLVERVPSVLSLKDSSGDLQGAYAIQRRFGDRIGVFSGVEWQSGPALLMGAAGLVNGAANIFPREFAHMFAASRSGDSAAVTAEWMRLLPALLLLTEMPFVSAIKHATNHVSGVSTGPVRGPEVDVSSAQLDELRRVLDGIMSR